MKYETVCIKCGFRPDKIPSYKCPKCGGILDIHYHGPMKIRQNETGIYKYADRLPVSDSHHVTLGEGGTPLISADKLGRRLENGSVYLKVEGMNPTGSFKDRAMAVAVSFAQDIGVDTMIVASSGNTAASAAAYAAKCGMRLVALVPESTPLNKVVQVRMHEGIVAKVPGGYSNSYALGRKMAEQYGWLDITTTFIDPYPLEGYKTIGYELFEQIGVPDWVVIPVGAGPILAKVYKAFCELRTNGIIDRVPSMGCIQSANCGPIAAAFVNGKSKVESVKEPKLTLASGINDGLVGYEEDGDYTLDCIRKSGGAAVLLNEEQIANSVKLLADDGVFAEPAGAVGAVGTLEMYKQNVIKAGQKVVIIVTGNGLKNPIDTIKGEVPIVSDTKDLMKYIEIIH